MVSCLNWRTWGKDMTATIPLVDFDLAIFAPSPPPSPSAPLDEATVERALDAIRAEFRAVKVRLHPSED